jgi:hypothetical protein
VQVDVGEQRRHRRPLPRSPLQNLDPSVFENARPQPFLDEADDALVADAAFEEADEPLLARPKSKSFAMSASTMSFTLVRSMAVARASSASCVPRPGRKP